LFSYYIDSEAYYTFHPTPSGSWRRSQWPNFCWRHFSDWITASL